MIDNGEIFYFVIPAKAGIQCVVRKANRERCDNVLGPGLRRGDAIVCGRARTKRARVSR